MSRIEALEQMIDQRTEAFGKRDWENDSYRESHECAFKEGASFMLELLYPCVVTLDSLLCETSDPDGWTDHPAISYEVRQITKGEVAAARSALTALDKQLHIDSETKTEKLHTDSEGK